MIVTYFEFIETSVFSAYLPDYLSDEEYTALQEHLCEAPEAGDLVRGSVGVRKLRWARAGVGKSSGVRICYYARTRRGQILMLGFMPKAPVTFCRVMCSRLYVRSWKMALTDQEKELQARDAHRDIGAELLAAVREAKAGRWARKTVFAVQSDGAVQRRIERADGTVEKEELLTGPRWELMAARAQSGMSQFEFAQALGVSKRTLENWEQGRAEPTGAARRLLMLAARFPDTLQRLAGI